jgi:hypothetical protein
MSQSDCKSDDLLRDKNVRGMLGGHEVGPGRKPCSAFLCFFFFISSGYIIMLSPDNGSQTLKQLRIELVAAQSITILLVRTNGMVGHRNGGEVAPQAIGKSSTVLLRTTSRGLLIVRRGWLERPVRF